MRLQSSERLCLRLEDLLPRWVLHMAVGRRFPWLESPHNVALLSMSDMRVSQNLRCLL